MSNPFDDTYEVRGVSIGGGGGGNDGRRGIVVRPNQQQQNSNTSGFVVGTTTNPFDDTTTGSNNFSNTNNNTIKPKTTPAVVLSSRRPPAAVTSISDKQQQQQQQQGQRVVSPIKNFLTNNTNNNNAGNDNDNNSWNSQNSSYMDGGSDDNDDDDDNCYDIDRNNNKSSNTVPAEASWQYLGDLPYRRVPIYYNVSWERKKDNNAIITGTGTGTGTSPTNTTTNNNSLLLLQHGLSTFPSNVLRYHPKILDPREIRTLFNNTTKTLVKGCPNGGPIAVMTIPVVGSSTSSTTGTRASTNAGNNSGAVPNTSASSTSTNNNTAFTTTTLHVWTNSGKLLFQMEFPPPPPIYVTDNSILSGTSSQQQQHQQQLQHRYTASDILTMGFTNRTTLIIILRDSYCYTINLRGEYILQPFYILPRATTSTTSTTIDGTPPNVSTGSNNTVVGNDLLLAHIYDGGVAVLSTTKDTAIVELLDYHDDISYLQTAHPSARKIIPTTTSTTTATTSNSNKVTLVSDAPPTAALTEKNILVSVQDTVASSNYALITIIPTGKYANQNFCHYCSLAVLSRARTSSKHPEIFLSTSDNSVITIDVSTLQIIDVNCRNQILSPIIDMCFAPNGRFLACYTQSNIVTVISTSFETKILDFDTSEGSNMPPLDMKWCGEDSVVLHWKNLGVLMIGPYGDWLRFPYENIENLYIIPEIDCCRIVTDTAVEVLQRVPPATALLLRIGSIETSAILLDASDSFYSNSTSSDDEAARNIIRSGMLYDAIETCTDSAMKEYDIHTQKRLLRAASYGIHFSYKSTSNTMDNNDVSSVQRVVLGGPVTGSPLESGILPSETTVRFVDAARKLRVMNALRNPNVGFILTSNQYDTMTPNGIVARLIAMKRPALATAISQYLNLSTSVQLFARASKAIAVVELDKNRSDSEVASTAIRIINNTHPVQTLGGDDIDTNRGARVALSATTTTTTTITSNASCRGAYAMVAIAAQRAGRPGVAKLLLQLEPSVPDKVPALVSTDSFAEAIAVATAARDANFIFSILMEYERTCMVTAGVADAAKGQTTFMSTVVSKFTGEAFHTLRRYQQMTADVKSVTSLLLRAQKFADAGEAMAKHAMQEDDIREKQGFLGEAIRIFGLGKDTALHKSCTEDYVELLKDQEILRTKYGSIDVCPPSSSVTAAIASVIHFAASNVREQHRLLADADKLAKKYRVTEKRLWHIKVKAFADSNQWSNLRVLGDSRSKPPIGYKPFAKAAINGKQTSAEILRYIERVTVPEERYDLFCEALQWKKALEEAAKMKDARRIINVKSLCNSSELALQADQILGRLA